MGKGSDAPSPDPNIGIAALKNAQLGEEWLAVSKEQFGVANERQKGLDALTKQVTTQQLGAAKQAQQWGTEDRARYTNTFVPLQDKFIEQAQNWDSPERQAKLAGEAKADVMTNAALGQQQSQRQMSAMGIRPDSGRYAGINAAQGTLTALGAAGAENQARNTSRQQGLALQGDAINLGAGLGVNPATSLGLGVNAGTNAANTALGAEGNNRANSGILGSGYQTAMSGYQNQANILNQQYGNQLNAWNAEQQQSSGLWGGLGSLAGMAMFMKSDEDAKTDKEPSKGNLDAVKAMRVDDWNYKPGEGDTARHTGTYAQDFQRATGRGDGRSIPVIDAIGVSMGAIKELAEQVDKLTGRGIRPRAKLKEAA